MQTALTDLSNTVSGQTEWSTQIAAVKTQLDRLQSAASSDASARVFAAATGAELARLDHDGEVTAVVFSPDGTRVATASCDESGGGGLW